MMWMQKMNSQKLRGMKINQILYLGTRVHGETKLSLVYFKSFFIPVINTTLMILHSDIILVETKLQT